MQILFVRRAKKSWKIALFKNTNRIICSVFVIEISITDGWSVTKYDISYFEVSGVILIELIRVESVKFVICFISFFIFNEYNIKK